MNINKIVKDTVSSVKNTYDNTQLNPFKMPENINITLTIDYETSVSNLFKALGKVKQEDMDNIFSPEEEGEPTERNLQEEGPLHSKEDILKSMWSNND